MKTLEHWLKEYGESHQHPTNKLIHWVCIPLITFFKDLQFLFIGPLWLLAFLFRQFRMRY